MTFPEHNSLWRIPILHVATITLANCHTQPLKPTNSLFIDLSLFRCTPEAIPDVNHRPLSLLAQWYGPSGKGSIVGWIFTIFTTCRESKAYLVKDRRHTCVQGRHSNIRIACGCTPDVIMHNAYLWDLVTCVVCYQSCMQESERVSQWKRVSVEGGSEWVSERVSK